MDGRAHDGFSGFSGLGVAPGARLCAGLVGEVLAVTVWGVIGIMYGLYLAVCVFFALYLVRR